MHKGIRRRRKKKDKDLRVIEEDRKHFLQNTREKESVKCLPAGTVHAIKITQYPEIPPYRGHWWL